MNEQSYALESAGPDGEPLSIAVEIHVLADAVYVSFRRPGDDPAEPARPALCLDWCNGRLAALIMSPRNNGEVLASIDVFRARGCPAENPNVPDANVLPFAVDEGDETTEAGE